MTTKHIAKLAALRAEAQAHGDSETVILVDAALKGNQEAIVTLGIAAQAVRAVSTGRASRAPRIHRRAPGFTAPSHPWAHDEE